jgi:xyloglucan-specific exo-beta-1,4-glucanase
MIEILKTKIKIACLLLIAAFPLVQTNLAHSQSYQWSNVKIVGGGFVTGIITSKTEQDLMYARTDVGGAYRWDPVNSQWIPLLDWVASNESSYLGVSSLAIDPQSPNNLYMLCGLYNGKTAILRSNDYGNTFSITDVTVQFTTDGNGMGRQNGERLAVDPHNGNIIYCGTRYKGLFKSADAGATWSNVASFGVPNTPNGNGICFTLFDPASDTIGNITNTIFFGVSRIGKNLFMSNDGGTSFIPVPGADTTLMPQKAVLASDSNLYVTYANLEGPWNPTQGKIWKYNIPTSVWTNVTPSGPLFPFSGISVDPNNPQRLLASTINVWKTQYSGAYGDRFFLSNDGGSTWRDLVGSGITLDASGSTLINNQAIHWAGSIEFDPFNTNKAWINSGNGIFSCDDVNAVKTTWKFNAAGVEEAVPADIASITLGPLLSAIYDYDGFIHTDITQYAPIHTPRIGTTTGIAFAALNPDKLLRVGGDATYGGKMYYSTNRGSSWTKTTSIKGYQGKVAISADGNIFLHCPSGSSTMYRSTNNGASWTACSGISISDAVPVADMVNPNKFYVYNITTGVMMVSTDGGVSFSGSGYAGTSFYKIIRTVPGMEGHLWVPASSGGLKRSTDAGATFTNIAAVSNCKAVGLGKAATNGTYHTLYIWGTVSGVTGIFRSTDEGVTWVRVNDDAHEYGGIGNGQFVAGDMNVYGRVYMSTGGRGIVYGYIQSAPVNQTITGPINVPSNSTGITYSIPADSGSTFNWVVPSDATIVSGQGTNSITVNFGNNVGTVEVTETNSLGNAASGLTVYIQFPPVRQPITGPVNVSANAQGISYSVLPNPGSAFNWVVPSGATIASGQGTDSITVNFGSTGGTVQVTETNSYGSAVSDTTVNVGTVTGISSSASSSSVNVLVYPNPFSEKVNITFNASSSSGLTLKVVDMKGELVYESAEYHTNEKITLGDELRGTGIYLVMAICDNDVRFVKIEKK